MQIAIFTTNSMPGIVAFKEFIVKYNSIISTILVFPQIPKSLKKQNLKFASFIMKTSLTLLFYKILENTVYNYLRVLFRKDTIYSLGKRYNIPVRKYDNPNETVVREYLMNLETDIIINCAPAIIKKETIDIPKKGCFNFHAALLPNYRGVANYFWFLITNAREAGGALHYLVPGIDEGDVVVQEKFQIDKIDTVHSINYKTNAICSSLLNKLIIMIEKGELTAIKQDESLAQYRSFPTRKDIRQFKRSGRKLFTLKDYLISLKH